LHAMHAGLWGMVGSVCDSGTVWNDWPKKVKVLYAKLQTPRVIPQVLR